MSTKVDLIKLFEQHWLLISLIFIISVIIIEMRVRSKRKSNNKNEWVLRAFYFAPNDPSILVPKPNGLGYTPNFAHVYCRIPTTFALTILVVGLFELFGLI